MVWKTLGQAAISSFGAGAGRAAMEHVLQGSGRGRRAGRFEVSVYKEGGEWVVSSLDSMARANRYQTRHFLTKAKAQAYARELRGWKEYTARGSSARGRRASGRRSGREINPYSKRYTFDQFKKRYFGNRPVPRQIAKEFWSDFRYAYVGGLQKYIKETRGEAARGRRATVPGQWLRRVGYGSLLASTFAVGGMGNKGRANFAEGWTTNPTSIAREAVGRGVDPFWFDQIQDMANFAMTTHGSTLRDRRIAALRLVRVAKTWPLRGSIIVERQDGAKFYFRHKGPVRGGKFVIDGKKA